MTQNQMIINHLKEHGAITPLEALREYGVERLASRIHDIRGMKYKVRTNKLAVKNRFGKTTYIAQYSLEEDEKCIHTTLKEVSR